MPAPLSQPILVALLRARGPHIALPTISCSWCAAHSAVSTLIGSVVLSGQRESRAVACLRRCHVPRIGAHPSVCSVGRWRYSSALTQGFLQASLL
ncbi:hypothetical protein CABS03_08876 [Colletotrichum abscissum]|uniref:Uncharacterized protein n=2 Tax=Colletotrichum acutatum species complex TaxID=2707335 RepID=A0A9Q0AWE5_9PEZI|nr:hypothetical protein CABS02_14088 [Colletotrichum abscissum]KAK0368614.1 hypothetical protein CLIM01_14030 [Colletotrichum limetticola]